MNINWYPGHMAKTKRELKECIKLIDVVVEILDARIPLSSRNPDVDEIVGDKPRIIVFNKIDLADDVATKKWMQFFKSQKIQSVCINSVNGNGMKELLEKIVTANKEQQDRLKAKGILGRNTRVLIIGIPNVGKSSLINRLAGKSIAQVGDKPGVTKANKWIRVANNIELLDTPGILWPKFEDEQVGLNLAFANSIKSEVLDIEEIAKSLLGVLLINYYKNICSRYKITETSKMEDTQELFDLIGKKRGCLLPGGVIDENKTATIILDDFQSGKLGRITLEIVKI